MCNSFMNTFEIVFLHVMVYTIHAIHLCHFLVQLYVVSYLFMSASDMLTKCRHYYIIKKYIGLKECYVYLQWIK